MEVLIEKLIGARKMSKNLLLPCQGFLFVFSQNPEQHFKSNFIIDTEFSKQLQIVFEEGKYILWNRYFKNFFFFPKKKKTKQKKQKQNKIDAFVLFFKTCTLHFMSFQEKIFEEQNGRISLDVSTETHLSKQ